MEYEDRVVLKPTIILPRKLKEELDRIMREKGYSSYAELIRELIRNRVEGGIRDG